MPLARRTFLRTFSLAAALPRSLSRAVENGPRVRFGIISDLHHGQFGHDEVARMNAFQNAMSVAKPDFIIQCGDLTQPDHMDALKAAWERFPGPKYHVLGNHDMDRCTKEEFMQVWGMKRACYSFSAGGFHCIVLDRNFIREADGTWLPYSKANWYKVAPGQKSHCDGPQLDWLREELAAAKAPVLIFMHQPVFLTDHPSDTGNADAILAIIDQANLAAARKDHAGRVVAVFMGHDHNDLYATRNGVHYVLLNSASYAYADRHGASYYQDALFALVTLDAAKRTLIIEGRASRYAANAPDEVQATYPPRISDHTLVM